jgi:hypothetical protein
MTVVVSVQVMGRLPSPVDDTTMEVLGSGLSIILFWLPSPLVRIASASDPSGQTS